MAVQDIIMQEQVALAVEEQGAFIQVTALQVHLTLAVAVEEVVVSLQTP